MKLTLLFPRQGRSFTCCFSEYCTSPALSEEAKLHKPPHKLCRSGASISPFHGEASRSALDFNCEITGIKPSTPVHHCQKFSSGLPFSLYLRISPTLPLRTPSFSSSSSSSSSPADRSCLHRSLCARTPPHASWFGVPVACDSGKTALPAECCAAAMGTFLP